MPDLPVLECPTCSAELPAEETECARCGTPTPSVTTGGPAIEVRSADEVEYRERLQRALGEDYHLGALIGRGGFGAVYTAWDTPVMGRVQNRTRPARPAVAAWSCHAARK